jgi:hypothetical protein
VPEYGDHTDLQARLQAIRDAGDTKLVTVFGSGISNSVLPSTTDLTARFRSYLSVRGQQKFDETITEISDRGLAYQNAASLVKHQQGEAVLARAIREAVLTACTDVQPDDRRTVSADIEHCRQLAASGNWRIPNGYARFARFYSQLPGEVRGPIITTNFDPLIEVAFRQTQLSADAVPIPMDSAPSADMFLESSSIPVLHIHGLWTSNATLSTIPQLTGQRPTLGGLLDRVMQSAAVLVVGYGGWVDAFMRSLQVRVERSDLLDSEFLWAAYSQDSRLVLQNETLAAMVALPGFNLYCGVDGQAIFDPAAYDALDVPPLPSPFGYSRVPKSNTMSTDYSASRFADGHEPTWADVQSDQWPVLSASKQFQNMLESKIEQRGGGIVAIGPMGEGKSMALRQAAYWTSTYFPEWIVLWSEPAAPAITPEWIENVRDKYGNVIIFIDNADLVAPALIQSFDSWGGAGSGVIFALASHDRLWWRYAGSLANTIDSIVFSGFTMADAVKISDSWSSNSISTEKFSADGGSITDAVADALVKSGSSMFGGGTESTTLFGAILDVRYGNKLIDRVSDLISRLAHTKIHRESDTTLADVFGCICVMQCEFDPRGEWNRGASRPLIASLANLPGVYADGKILNWLGREAAIAYAGDRVYSRHPSLARAAVAALREKQMYVSICEQIGRTGGRLRRAGGVNRDLYTDAYQLGSTLKTGAAAVAAATGAVEGAGYILEPRVTLMSVLRLNDRQRAFDYAMSLAPHLPEFRDEGSALRVYFNEFSVICRHAAHPQLGLGLAALSIADGIGYGLDESRADYGLSSVVLCGLKLREQSADLVGDIPELAWVALTQVLGGSRQVRIPRERLAASIHDIERLPAAQLRSQLTALLVPFARSAVSAVKPAIEFAGMISLRDLARLCRL